MSDIKKYELERKTSGWDHFVRAQYKVQHLDSKNNTLPIFGLPEEKFILYTVKQHLWSETAAVPVKEMTSTSGELHKNLDISAVFSRSEGITLNTPLGIPASSAIWAKLTKNNSRICVQNKNATTWVPKVVYLLNWFTLLLLIKSTYQLIMLFWKN